METRALTALIGKEETDIGYRNSHITPLLFNSKEAEYTQLDTSVTVERVILQKHITLLHVIGLIIGGVAGSGIFISRTVVTLNACSVGSSLIKWALAGLFNLLLAVYNALYRLVQGTSTCTDILFTHMVCIFNTIYSW